MIINLLERITKALEQKDIPYMLSGSIALSVYCVPRMTMDIDIVLELPIEKSDEFLAIFKNGFYVDAKTVMEENRRKGMFNVIDEMSGLKIDFIVRKETEYRKLEFQRKRRDSIAGVDVWLVSPEDLIISKIEWIQVLKSEKQMNDINNLLAIEGLDMEYIKQWCLKLKLDTTNFF